MRVHSNPGGRFKQARFIKPHEIDDMCVQALAEAGLLPAEPSPIRIDRFIEKHFGCALVYEDVMEGVLGCTLFEKNGAVKAVAVSPGLDDGTVSGARRERSTLAHEGGHCLMHPILFMEAETQMSFDETHENLDFRERRILCREGDISGRGKRYDGRWWEYQANRAIGGLLLPHKLVAQCVTPCFRSRVAWAWKRCVQIAAERRSRAWRIHSTSTRLSREYGCRRCTRKQHNWSFNGRS